MKRLLCLSTLLLLVACQSNSAFIVSETHVESRGVQIPVTFALPNSTFVEKVPLVVMAHGHGGSREEAGAFTRVARSLAENGIASVRMDFPGCGESSEPFTENTLTNMLDDIRASREFAAAHPRVDAERIGILGYSMGGRLAILASVETPYRVMALWNAASSDGAGNMITFLGGPDAYTNLRMAAMRDGAAEFTTPWGDRQQLSLRWFEEMESSFPKSAIALYTGALLVLYGEEDRVIDPRASKIMSLIARRGGTPVVRGIKNGDHGFGFYSDNQAVADEVATTTVEFFKAKL